MKQSERDKTILIAVMFLIDTVGDVVSFFTQGGLFYMVMAVVCFAISIFYFKQASN